MRGSALHAVALFYLCQPPAGTTECVRWTEGRVPGLVKSVYSWRTDGWCDNYNAASEAFELSQDAQWGAAGGITPPNDQVQVRPVVGRSRAAFHASSKSP